ncbi:MAG TPA: hypothetical protein VJX67_23260, partial [Blastocatellia bacterium]|nr:hypothetical protein [Blastocatellia bacterium]
KRGRSRNLYLRNFAVALSLAMAMCAPPALCHGVKANRVSAANPCGSPSLFAFPNANVKQGEPVTVFVTETNQTAIPNPFVVNTEIVAPNLGLVVDDIRVVNVDADGSTSYAINIQTGQLTPIGTYTVIAESFQGSELGASPTFCSHAQTTFTVVCDSNNCTPQR